MKNLLAVCAVILSVCAIIMAAGTVITLAKGNTMQEDITDWKTVAEDLDAKGGRIYYATGANSPQYTTIDATHVVSAEQGFIKVYIGGFEYAYPYDQILYVFVNS